MTENGGPGGPIEHGFPHLATVRASITALFRRLSADGIRAHATSITPADAAFDAADDLHLGAQRVAAATLRALRLPDARMVVSFRAMEEAATVELAAGPEYFVEVNDRFRTHRRDLAAALSHEVAHVLLHRLGPALPGRRRERAAHRHRCRIPGGRLAAPGRLPRGRAHPPAVRLPHAGGVRLRPGQARRPVRRGPLPLVHQPPGVRGLRTRAGARRARSPPGPAGGRRTAGPAPVREGAARRGLRVRRRRRSHRRARRG